MLMKATDWLDKNGLPPIAGGWMDQTQQFLDGADFVRNEKAAALTLMAKK